MSDLLTIVYAATTATVLALSGPAIWKTFGHSLCVRPTKYNRILSLSYHDEDGEASGDLSIRCQAETSLVTRRLVIFSAAAHTTLIIIRSWFLPAFQSSPLSDGLALIGGIVLLLQALSLNSEPEITGRYRLGIRGAWSWQVMAVALVADIYKNCNQDSISIEVWVVWLCSTIVILLGLGACLSFPRRPKIFRDSNPVDGQFTTSVLGRLSFGWATDIMSAAKNTEIPQMTHKARAKSLHESFKDARSSSMSLWRTIFYLHRGVFMRQISLTTAVCFLGLIPSVALFEILQALDQPTDDKHQTRLWTNVALLVLGVLLSSTLDTWKVWLSFNCLSLRIFEQLSLAVFDKSMLLPSACTFVDPDATEKGAGDSMNLLAVDAKYVADCVCFSYVLYKAPLQMAISGIYLARLLGWQSLVAAGLVLAFLTPFNVYAARKYTLSQQNLMLARDQKMQVLTEVLQLIRQIKFFAQESLWEKVIGRSRDKELIAQWHAFLWSIVQLAVYLTTPVVLSVVCLGVHAMIYRTLSTPTAFSAISVLNSIEIVMYALPDCIARTSTGLNSMKRIEQHLELRENSPRAKSATSVEFINATLGWISSRPGESVNPILREVTLCFPPSKLSLVTGPTGCGKSLLLASILGESMLLGGVLRVPDVGKYTYVAQVPWLENTSVRENILFGNQLDIGRYKEVLFACALDRDLTLFPDGDKTEIGPSGVNLSGGQKWRISLARALYSPANILVMDDIFAAVDVHTASHLFLYGLTGPLAQGRTRILVTHHISLCLPRTDYIVSLDNGSVQYAGPVTGLSTDIKQSSINLEASLHTMDKHEPITTQMSDDQDFSSQEPERSPSQFVKDEHRQEGPMQWRIWKLYLTAGGSIVPWIWVMLAFGGYSLLLTARAWWLHIWSDHEKVASCDSAESTACAGDDLLFYLGVYLGLGGLACIIGTARSYLTLQASLHVARKLFDGLLHTILHTPLRWLDVVPPGRIMNRFIVDILVVDSLLGDDIQSTLANAFDMALAVVAGSLVSPWLILPAVGLCIVCVRCGQIYLNTARELRRLENVLKSSIFEHVRSALSGIWTIRAEAKTAIYLDKVTESIDHYARAYWQLWLLNCWLAFRMDVLGALFAMAASTLVVTSPRVSASLAGFAITFALKLAQSMSLTVRRYASLELSMNSVERILEYSEVRTEPIYQGDSVPSFWPRQGCVQVSNLSVSYASDLPPALHNVSFTIGPAERVGVVGRTGSGKSSLVLALFRFLEADEGSIVIDGLDISMLNLHQLRERLSIVPQTPAVFSGTLRTNLDPFGQYSDEQLLAALQDVQWNEDLTTPASPVKATGDIPDNESQTFSDDNESAMPLMTMHHTTTAQLPTTTQSLLDYPVAADGQNLSQGGRQLLCLARAILQRPKFLVLDEVTSSIDQSTDQKVQASIRRISKLNSMSLLVVAHRLSTVVDFDRILVLSDGHVAEFGHPRELMQQPSGVFRAMMLEHGEEDSLVQ
ncbi:ABC bile acid transporter [Penicillium robsamsonii]|uniref:ABC bile acid transporter n=1 Tax=Penicillium robsamsonii TaxID=1792511 RepID=UPI002546FC60|nr:ABC bile acid transporter [Penicillium robsamsonii]KAJ5836573.1 ABC bile acid transporter [Penicillium robsamsonii]